MLVALEEIKGYLRIDSDAEDNLLTSFADTAEQLSLAILRAKLWKEVKKQEAARTAVLYAVAYLYENREEAAHDLCATAPFSFPGAGHIGRVRKWERSYA